MWLVFAGFAAGAAGLSFLLDSLLSWRLRPLAPGIAQAALAVGLYPPLAWPLARLHGAMRRAENAP
jgi:rod shape-determining protein MreD